VVSLHFPLGSVYTQSPYHCIAPPPPRTLTKEWQEASNERAIEQKMNPITGMFLCSPLSLPRLTQQSSSPPQVSHQKDTKAKASSHTSSRRYIFLKNVLTLLIFFVFTRTMVDTILSFLEFLSCLHADAGDREGYLRYTKRAIMGRGLLGNECRREQ